MKTFSLKRMMQLCRLQINEIYGTNKIKTLTLAICLIIAISLFAVILNPGDISESVESAEKMLIFIPVAQITLLYADMASSKLVIPASTLEKYVAVYAETLFVIVVFIALAILTASAFFTAASAIMGQDNGLITVFLRKDIIASHGALAYSLFMVTWFCMFAISRKRYSKLTFWGIIIGMCIMFLLPLAIADYIEETAARIIAIVVAVAMAVVCFVWGYRLLKNFEMDTKEND